MKTRVLLGSCGGVVNNMLDSDIIVVEFDLYSHF